MNNGTNPDKENLVKVGYNNYLLVKDWKSEKSAIERTGSFVGNTNGCLIVHLGENGNLGLKVAEKVFTDFNNEKDSLFKRFPNYSSSSGAGEFFGVGGSCPFKQFVRLRWPLSVRSENRSGHQRCSSSDIDYSKHDRAVLGSFLKYVHLEGSGKMLSCQSAEFMFFISDLVARGYEPRDIGYVMQKCAYEGIGAPGQYRELTHTGIVIDDDSSRKKSVQFNYQEGAEEFKKMVKQHGSE